MKNLWLGSAVAMAPLIVLGGCRGSTREELEEGAPEQAAFQMQLTGDVVAESLASDADLVAAAEGTADALEAMGGASAAGSLGGASAVDVAPALGEARSALKDFNGRLREFLQPVVALLREEVPRGTRSLAVWGPVTRGATEYRLTIARGNFRRYGWLLEARVAESGEDFVRVAAGRIAVGDVPRRGIGVAGFDLHALGEADPTVQARGEMLVGFAHGDKGASLSYTVRDFTPDPSRRAAFDARWRGIHLERGLNVVRFGFRGNLPETATDAEEVILARARHRVGRGGRLDAIVTGGDVEAGKALVRSECFEAGGELSFAILRECTESELEETSCTIVSQEGERSGCLPEFLEERLPPSDPMEDAEEPDDPNEPVDPPEAMPDGSPEE